MVQLERVGEGAAAEGVLMENTTAGEPAPGIDVFVAQVTVPYSLAPGTASVNVYCLGGSPEPIEITVEDPGGPLPWDAWRPLEMALDGVAFTRSDMGDYIAWVPPYFGGIRTGDVVPISGVCDGRTAPGDVRLAAWSASMDQPYVWTVFEVGPDAYTVTERGVEFAYELHVDAAAFPEASEISKITGVPFDDSWHLTALCTPTTPEFNPYSAHPDPPPHVILGQLTR